MTRFESFVVLAEMRTGSNLLEAALNLLPGVACHGEAFNPALIGYPKKNELLGVTRAERDADPMLLLDRIRNAPGLNGCRYFHDHDPRVLMPMLTDPACAKIVLTRNPVESYISLEIARTTGQWKLGDAKHRKAARATFDAETFETHLAELQDFQIALLHVLQSTGQTAFFIDYEDARDLEVLNGLAKWLGVEGHLDALPSSLVPQNPEALETKVTNFPEMETSLARLDRFNLSRTPNFEPRRGPQVPGFVGIGAGAGLLYMPLRPTTDGALRSWLAGLAEPEEGFSQKTLRQWKRCRPGHRSFTVLRHPLMRAHLALDTLLSHPDLTETRGVLRKTYRLPLPAEGKSPDAEGWARLLEAFLHWLRSNLNAQTSLPVLPFWASQSALVQGFAQFGAPDLLARQDRLENDLAYLATTVDIAPPPAEATAEADPAPVQLSEIYSSALEKAARETYRRDFMQFGFGNWRTA